MYDQANNEFRAAVAQSPNNAMYRVRWGRLLHERFNNTDADDLFNEALKIDPKNAQAYLGLALVSADGFDEQGRRVRPEGAGARSEARGSARTDGQSRAGRFRHEAAVAASGRSPASFRPTRSTPWRFTRPSKFSRTVRPMRGSRKSAQVNPTYGEGYAIVAHHLVLNRRYEDGIAYYRKAIEADPQLWSARSELGINLMRLGQEDEPRQQLEMCYNNGYRDAATVNSLRLLDSYKNFVTFKDDTTILKLQQEGSRSAASLF